MLLAILVITTYLLQVLLPGTTGFLELRCADVGTRPWTILSSELVHSGYDHFWENIVAFIPLAFLVEGIAGTRRFLGIVLVSALASGGLTVLVMEECTLKGLSGVDLGLFGSLLAFYLPRAALLGLGFTLGVGLLLLKGVFHAGHVGGFVAGYLVGVFWKESVDPWDFFKKAKSDLLTLWKGAVRSER